MIDMSRFAPDEHAPDAPRPAHRRPRWWWGRVEVSANTHRSFGHTAPVMRGWSHLLLAVVWPALVVLLLQQADPGREFAGALVFGGGMQVMFTASAITHLKRWDVWTTEALFRVDHAGIFLAIAGGITPFTLLVIGGWLGTVVLVGVWLVTLGGMAFTFWPSRTPVGFGNTIFITLGALVLPFLPLAWARIGTVGVALLLGGGALYIVGAIWLAHQWPRLSPKWFGYHEVWHLMVVVATLLHYVMIRDHYLTIS